MFKKSPVLMAILILAAFALFFSAPAQAQDRDIYIIGVVEPLNKTENPGHIEFPYYGEVMQEVLSSPANNYIVKILDSQELEAAGYRFSSVKNDVDLQSDQIQKLCLDNRLDALLTGRIKNVERNLEPRFMAEAGRFMDLEMEGLLYDRTGKLLWNKTVSGSYEFTRKEGKFRPPFHAQVVGYYSEKTRELARSLIDRIGTKPSDREAPAIDFESIRSGDKIRTTCLILKGKVSDNSKVDKIIVNGQEFPLLAPQKDVDMFYPVKLPNGVKGQRVLITIEARDIYGFKFVKELNLTWDTPVKGIITSVNPDTISMGFSGEDFKKVVNGTGFFIYSIDEFVDPLSSHRFRMFTADLVGPVVVVKTFPSKGVVQAKFFKGHEKLIEMVKKNDIAR
jgi:hypothetical protein